MSEVVRVRSRWTPRPETVQVVTNTAAVAEVAARAAVGAMGVRAVITVVRDHPVLTILLASGIGYLLGSGLRTRPARVGASTAVD